MTLESVQVPVLDVVEESYDNISICTVRVFVKDPTLLSVHFWVDANVYQVRT
jgi:hypothetical protein